MARVCFVVLMLVELFVCPLVCSSRLMERPHAQTSTKRACCCARCRPVPSERPAPAEQPQENASGCVCAGCLVPTAADPRAALDDPSTPALFALLDVQPHSCALGRAARVRRFPPDRPPESAGRALRITIQSFLC